MGPAVVEAVRVCPEIRVIAVNNTWRLARWADVLFAADATWWKQYHEETKGFVGLKATCDGSGTPFDDVLQLKESGKEGFDDNPATIRTGGNSGYAAVHIAAHLGCSRILLCGFDMRGGHWHERHKYPLRDAGDGIFPRWIARFQTLAPELAKRGIEVLNCTPGSALQCFRAVELTEALGARAIAA